MAISPVRMALFKGVNAMSNGVSKPFQKATLGGRGITNTKRANTIAAGNKARLGGRGTTPPSRGKIGNEQTNKPKEKLTFGSKPAPVKQFNSTAAGDKKYGISGRSMPNIGPVSAQGAAGYKKRTQVQAAKAALANTRNKRVQFGGNVK